MWLKTDYIELPEQEKLCSRPNTSCSYIHKRIGLNRYERRLAVITEDGQMVVYKYFLLGITAGLPLIGRVYDLTQLKDKKIRFEKKAIHIRLWTKDNKKITFRLASPEEQILLPAFLE
ncbi:unnamed protein product [Auanema sp. JU1783]|nr:unnamed protein product [Auanema sp. JU1783]